MVVVVVVYYRFIDMKEKNNFADAPGWKDSSSRAELDPFSGPTCWKCKGAKSVNCKKGNSKACPACKGRGYMKSLKGKAKHTLSKGVVRFGNRPNSYRTPGPVPIGNPKNKPRLVPQDGEELCFLCGHYKIFQAIKGHRFSTDDVCTAWYAGIVAKREKLKVARHIDLGCGIGSVLLMVAWQFQSCQSTGIEAQQRSFGMCKRSIEYNIGDGYAGGKCRVSTKHGNIENVAQFFPSAKNSCDLVTGTPPYFDTKMNKSKNGRNKPSGENRAHRLTSYGGIPTCLQSAPARYEFRGGIEVYCKAAAYCLKDTGRFVVCEGLLRLNASRVENAARDNGLVIVSRVDVFGLKGKQEPLFAVYEMAKCEPNSAFPGLPRVQKLIVRTKHLVHSNDYCNLLRTMGIPNSKDFQKFRSERRVAHKIALGVALAFGALSMSFIK